MMVSHLPRSAAKLVDLVARHCSRAAARIITSPEDGGADQPFCGAEISTSTPVACMSTQIVPEATQSSTNSPPTSCAASARART